ncbi:excalibur calcium-binding domain-containing protein [Streptomyces sp. NPDC058084]|uniref:excalibur calcium-binding domain-containing protein n=1 Tax=Streptomyces sp. NPDC058084 TaxID=3346333 RepID=UPI0036E6D8BA
MTTRDGPGWWSRRSRWGKAGLVVTLAVVAILALGAILSAVQGGPDRGPAEPVPSAPASESTASFSPAPPSSIPKAPIPPLPEPSESSSEPEPETTEPEPSPPASSAEVYYENCDAVRAAGAAPLLRGQRGYRAALDRDGDGMACDPYVGP